jgi:hypothetical protein
MTRATRRRRRCRDACDEPPATLQRRRRRHRLVPDAPATLPRRRRRDAGDVAETLRRRRRDAGDVAETPATTPAHVRCAGDVAETPSRQSRPVAADLARHARLCVVCVCVMVCMHVCVCVQKGEGADHLAHEPLSHLCSFLAAHATSVSCTYTVCSLALPKVIAHRFSSKSLLPSPVSSRYCLVCLSSIKMLLLHMV